MVICLAVSILILIFAALFNYNFMSDQTAVVSEKDSNRDKVTPKGVVFSNYLDEIAISKETFLELVPKARVNLRTPDKEPPYTLYMDGVGMLPKGDIWAIQAKYKNGKTQAASLIMAAVLGDDRFGLVAAPDNKTTKVLYFDTEQSMHNTIAVGHRVHRLLGWEVETNNSRFRTFNLREWDTEKKMPFILGAIDYYRPTMIVVDGIADLISSINDEQESVKCVRMLMQMATKYNCSIGGIIHTNKSKDDDNARGHVGTALYMKVVDMFGVEKKDGVFTLTHMMSRNKENGEKISWTIGENGVLVRSDKPADVLASEVREQKIKPWRMAFADLGKDLATHGELTEAYKRVTGLKLSSAKSHLNKAQEMGLVVKKDTFYTLV